MHQHIGAAYTKTHARQKKKTKKKPEFSGIIFKWSIFGPSERKINASNFEQKTMTNILPHQNNDRWEWEKATKEKRETDEKELPMKAKTNCFLFMLLFALRRFA